MRTILILIAASFLYSAGTALQAAENKRLTDAEFAALLASAEAGDSDAQFEVALAYGRGNGTDRNDDAARAWLDKAAAQSNPKALRFIARAYLTGRSLYEADEQRALEYFERAAATGDADANFDLGTALRGGWLNRVVPERTAPARAIPPLRRAAEQGHAAAMYHLGEAYRDGEGVAAGIAEARAWFEKAAAAGSQRAHKTLAEMYDKGDLLPRDIPRAIEHYRKAAELVRTVSGYIDSWYDEEVVRYQWRIAELHELKQPPDMQAAIDGYSAIASDGNRPFELDGLAEIRIARILADRGTPEQVRGGIGMMAEQGNKFRPPAMCFMVDVLQRGREGFAPDVQQAAAWLEGFKRTLRTNNQLPDDCETRADCRAKIDAATEEECAKAYAQPL